MTQTESYDGVTISLHWITALLVVVLWVIGQTADSLPKGALQSAYWSTHVVLGFTLVFVVLYRVGALDFRSWASPRRSGPTTRSRQGHPLRVVSRARDRIGSRRRQCVRARLSHLRSLPVAAARRQSLEASDNPLARSGCQRGSHTGRPACLGRARSPLCPSRWRPAANDARPDGLSGQN